MRLLALVLALTACAKSGQSPEFIAAQKALEVTIERTRDPSYAHPDFAAVELLFRAVPEDAAERASAISVADQMRAARGTNTSPRLEAEAKAREDVADSINHVESLAGGNAIRQHEQIKLKVKRIENDAAAAHALTE